MRIPNGPYVILEAKGGTSRLKNGQMRQRWIDRNLRGLVGRFGAQEPDFADAVNGSHPMLATVVKLNVNSNVRDPVLAVAFRGFTPNARPGLNTSWGSPFES